MKTPQALEWALLKNSFMLAEIAVDKALATPQPTHTDTEDYHRPDPNSALPSWNLWGDGGMVTRLQPWQPYTIEHNQPMSAQ